MDLCVVVNSEGIVLGLLRDSELESEGDAGAEKAMRAGPSTFRPHVPIAEMAKYMVEHDLESTLITTSEGKLTGVLFRQDAVDATHEQHEH